MRCNPGYRIAATVIAALMACPACSSTTSGSDAAPPDSFAADTAAPERGTADSAVIDRSNPEGGGGSCIHPKVVKSCSGGWCQVPAGCFYMGSPATEACRQADEDRHAVTLTHPFEIQSTETTQAQYKARMGTNPSYFTTCGSDCPVEQVTWSMAAAYCNALSRDKSYSPCYACTGSGAGTACQGAAAYAGAKIYTCPGYRLPTAAEWEYAYRAGSTTAYYNGASDPAACVSCTLKDINADQIGWYCVNSGSTNHPAGKKLANAWGLYDMAGNVLEWTGDWFVARLGTAAVTDPVGGTFGTLRAIRGGAYDDDAYDLRAGKRDSSAPAAPGEDLGFRCVRSTR